MFIKFISFLFILLLAFTDAFTQNAGDVLWEKYYGGEAYDEVMGVTDSPLGGFVGAGFTQSYGLGRWGNAFFVKTNYDGDSLWTYHLGGDGMDVFADVITTPDSMFVATGLTDTPNDFENIYLVKVDDNGSIQWEKNFGGPLKEVAQSLTNSQDGNIVITGVTKSFSVGEEDLFIFKTNLDGDSLWFKTYGTTGNDGGYGISITSDGGFIIAGQYNWSDLWLLKLDANGDTLWTKTFGGVDYEEGLDVKQTPDGGYIVCGSTGSFGAGQLDAYLVKTDSTGKLEWQNAYGGNGYDEGRRVVVNSSNGYILMANTDGGVPGEFDYLIIWTDLNGDTVKTKQYGESGEDRSYDVITVEDEYLLIGASNYNLTSDGDASMLLIYKNDTPSDVNDPQNVDPNDYYMSEAFPNPFNPSTKITFSVPLASRVIVKLYNSVGEELATLVDGFKSAGNHTFVVDGKSMSSGIYFVKMESGSFSETKKIVLMK